MFLKDGDLTKKECEVASSSPDCVRGLLLPLAFEAGGSAIISHDQYQCDQIRCGSKYSRA